MTPTIKAAKLVDVSSQGAPATITDVQTEQNKYAKILQDLKDAEQEIEDKIREGKEKRAEMKSKEVAKDKAFAESTELTKEESDKTTRVGRRSRERFSVMV